MVDNAMVYCFPLLTNAVEWEDVALCSLFPKLQVAGSDLPSGEVENSDWVFPHSEKVMKDN